MNDVDVFSMHSAERRYGADAINKAENSNVILHLFCVVGQASFHEGQGKANKSVGEERWSLMWHPKVLSRANSGGHQQTVGLLAEFGEAFSS